MPLSPDEKRKLKKAGKARVEQQSRELQDVMRQANPAPLGSDAWMDNYREGTERERRLRRRRGTLHKEALDASFVVLPQENAGLVITPELFLQCLGCESVLPMEPGLFFWSHCACGNLKITRFFRWQWIHVTEDDSVRPVKLVGKGTRL